VGKRLGENLGKKLFRQVFADRPVEAPQVEGGNTPPTYGDLAPGLVQVRVRRLKKINRTQKGHACFKQVFDAEVGVRYERIKKVQGVEGDSFAHIPITVNLEMMKPAKVRKAQKLKKAAKAENDTNG
jgi:hypothetical protein